MYRTIAESRFTDKYNVRYATDDVINESCTKFLPTVQQHRTLVYDEQQQQQSGDTKQTSYHQLIRSQSDRFDYRLIQLHNGVRALLISDSSIGEKYESISESTDCSDGEELSEGEEMSADESDTSSISNLKGRGNREKQAAIVVGVNVGSSADPRDAQGMAHMLEHMISMGSEAFPKENEIDDFLSSCGGYQNAHTEFDYTMYEVSVQLKYLKEAINLIGSAFVKPLLLRESIDREIEPVDTEFIESSSDDDCRLDLLLAHIAKPDHPMSTFLWGNRRSLIDDTNAKGLDIRKMLVDFYETHYQPQNIVVVVQAQESLDSMSEWVDNIFSKVKAMKDVQPTPLTIRQPFDNSRFHRFYLMEAIDSGTRLHINWSLPPQLDKYLSAPFDYLSNLIGHEGKGSLIAQLRKKTLAFDLVTDSVYFCFKNNRHCSIFSVDIYLTEYGTHNLDQVIDLFFEYMTVIRSIGAQDYYFQENQTIASQAFNLKSEKRALNNACDMAKNLLYFPVEHILIGNQLYYHYDKQSIDDLLALFTPETANFVHLGGPFRSNLTTYEEPWMGTKYQHMDVPNTWIEQAKRCTGVSDYFHYPKPNPFIATKFDLLKDGLSSNELKTLTENEYPTKIFHTDRLTGWYKPDLKFNLPKASIHVHIISPYLCDTLEHVALSDVLCEYLMLQLKEETYDALVANLNWDLTRTDNGIHFHVDGFNHKLTNLIVFLAERFKTLEIEEKFLEFIKKEVVKDYNNNYQESETFNQHLRFLILTKTFYTLIERWTQIESIDLNKLIKYKHQLLSNLSFEILLQGNLTNDEAIDVCKRFESMFNLEGKDEVPGAKEKNRVVQLPYGTKRIRALTITSKNLTSYVVCYYQLKPHDFQSHCYLSLFVDIISELCFNVLRTKEGLGYDVGCILNDTFGILGFNVYVSTNANKFDCDLVKKKINKFVMNVCKEYINNELTDEKFQKFISVMIKRKESPDLSLEREVARHWSEIVLFDYCFDRTKQEVSYLKKATLEQLKAWTEHNIFLPEEKCKSLTIEIVGNGNKSLRKCQTFDCKEVDPSMIPSDFDIKTLQLLRSNVSDYGFIDCVQTFKQKLNFYESIAPSSSIDS
ncbi:hypothetical protein RDWZM_002554 [Blomia tropicalis]|uniref:Nardilysin n=1 Tax=Blomia tropicalis TaxID=40697 RepID=A0A9Q0MDZ8_BLOTA|nr:hypothetical protein RDWZM_002554 [Blomia tropicalis]